MNLHSACIFLLGLTNVATAQRHLRKDSNNRRLKYFQRVATFPVCQQLDLTCDVDTETVAEIVKVTDDGMTAVYTDAELKALGFVDITNPKIPLPLGTMDLGDREPTSVSLKGKYALVAVNTSPDYISPSGKLVVIDMKLDEEGEDPEIVREIDLGGQPDAIDVSKDKKYAVIAIENERDEDLGDGEIPQAPAGFVVIVDIEDEDPTNWSTHDVDITDLSGVYEASDPEPEYVSINDMNQAVVTLQENNAAVVIDIESKTVINSFSTGSVDLTNVDTKDDKVIDQTETDIGVVREPDGVVWISNDLFATADEGDMLGGSRGFTIFSKDGSVVYESGMEPEHYITSVGHYPDKRSDNKGVEFENAAVASDLDLLFVISERSSVIMVYDIKDPSNPVFHQVLPSGGGPEGGVYVESRQLFVAATEVDDRGDKARASLVIYEYGENFPNYPSIMSVEDESIGNGVPISWSALSGLSPAANPNGPLGKTLYAVDDSAFIKSRIFTIETSNVPGVPNMITKAIYIKDSNDVFADFEPYGDFSAADLAAMINADKTVNLDSEGIAAIESGFWIASEGRGTIGDASRPVEKLNFLFRVDNDGVIEEVVSLPDEVNDIQLRFGFEGVTVDGDYVIVAFQRAWGDEPNPRLGLYNTVDETWKFVFYPLDDVESQNGGWVGLSDISSLGRTGDFLVLERDNQGGFDAAIKRIYKISLGDLGAVQDGYEIQSKVLVRDILEDTKTTGGVALEKVEGMAIIRGDVFVVNDNDAVDDNTGETQLLKFKALAAAL